MNTRYYGLLASASLLSIGLSATALAQTGASDDRVSLPEGPGSLEGVGENVGMNLSMGSMSYSVPFSVPQGFAGVTPSLELGYNSGGGNSIVGMGWSMSTPSIERMTYRGLPEYDNDDDFCVGGSDQLVRLPGTNQYRARFEGGFARYTWMNEGEGAEGYWLAEYPDGSKGYFGATSDGTLVPEARVGTDELGTFRYQLVEKVDVHGHKMVFDYVKFGHYALVDRISYVFTESDDGAPAYEVDFTYQAREDEGGVDYLFDGAPGFELLLTQRLARVDVSSRGQHVRHYRMQYEPYATSGGLTRLTEVAMYGQRDTKFPTSFEFEYSRTLGGVCDGEGCDQPFMMDMGNLGINVQSGQTTLLDINGDGLPDVVDTTEAGAHRFFMNIPSVNGTSQFSAEPRVSQTGTRGSHELRAPTTQVLDIDGDGFTDMINAATGQVLLNRGSGDWTLGSDVPGISALAEALDGDFDAEDGELKALKFIDYDGDKKIDLMRSTLDETSVYRNTGVDGFEVDNDVDALGAGFDEDGLQFADMNGDGLLDVVRLQPQTLSYAPNLGWGRFGEWVTVNNLPIDSGDIAAEHVELEDMNGDGLADVVVVRTDRVSYNLNTNTTSFTDTTELTGEFVRGELPMRDASTTVLYADMNANGSSDIVWITANGDVRVLELFPVRPNLMSEIRNSLGKVTQIEYSTGAVQMALDGGIGAWEHPLPFPMLVVSRTDTFELHSELHEISEYRYHDGYYDGAEKQFRGFARTEIKGLGDDFHEEGLTEVRYDVGAEDIYRKGLTLSKTVWSAGREFEVQEMSYSDCPVAEVPEGTELPVRYTCQTSSRTIRKEGQGASAWAVTEKAMEYDGYGNVTLSSDLGVTSIGGEGCEPCDRADGEFGAPCGAQCLGDESFTVTEFVPTNQTSGRWILAKSYRERTTSDLNSDVYTEKLTYYDGPDFEGMPLGWLDTCNVTRVSERVGVDGTMINTTRDRYDEHGNSVERLQANADLDGESFRRVYTYDPSGLQVTRFEELLTDNDGAPYRLRREFAYEPVYDRLISSTRYMLVRDGEVLSARDETIYDYDLFGRLSARVMPGRDTLTEPTEVYTYEIGNPISRVIVQKRSEVGGPFDITEIGCFDGLGRRYQSLTRVDDGVWQADGFQLFNSRSQALRAYQSYQTNSDACAMEPPEGVPYTESFRDALGRELTTTFPDAELYGGQASMRRVEYGPLTVATYDREDTDPTSPHFDTPVVKHLDGMGRVVAVDRLLERGAAPVRTQVHYDTTNSMIGFTDPKGNRKAQSTDLLGRIESVNDPNASGIERLTEYDDNGNVVRFEDERGVVVRTTFDGMNRPTSRYDESDPDNTLIEWIYDTPRGCPIDQCSNTVGLLAQVTYPGLNGERAADLFGYSVRNEMIYRGRRIAGYTFDMYHELDNANRIVETAFPDGQVLTRSYDGFNRVTRIGDFVTDMDYDHRGLESLRRYGNGDTLTFAYDRLLRPASRVVTNGQDDELLNWDYRYDRMNNLTVVADAAAGLPRGGTYTYDAWYRLTEATIAPETHVEETLSYGYDSLENLTSRTSSLDGSPMNTGAMGYNGAGPNALSVAGDLNMDYDASGQMIRLGATTMDWDFQQRLSRVELPDGRTLHNIYGSDPSRVAKQLDGSTSMYITSDFVVRDGIAEMYVSHGQTRMVRVESDALATTLLTDLAPAGSQPDGVITAGDAAMAHLAAEGSLNVEAPSEATALLWSSVRRLLMETGADDSITWLHHDHLGTSVLATAAVDGEQTTVGERRFYPFGFEADALGFVDAFGFTSKELDEATGFMDFGARFYAPQLGRWLSTDPSYATNTADQVSDQLVDATTAYTFVANNPITHFDPNGYDTVTFLPHANQDAQVKNVMSDNTHKVIYPGTSKGLKNSNITAINIVGHGNLGSAVGGHSPFDNYGPKNLVKVLMSEGLNPKTHKNLTITVIACNAGTYVHRGGNNAPRDPYIKRFADALAKRGFTNVKVEGYAHFVNRFDGRGYRTHNHKFGAVWDSTRSADEARVSYTINKKGKVGDAEGPGADFVLEKASNWSMLRKKNKSSKVISRAAYNMNHNKN